MSAALSATSRRQSAAVGQKRPYTILGGRSECSGRGHGRIQPFLHWPETAATHATSSFWCDVVRGRSTDGEVASRGPTALGRWIESNESNQRIKSARTAVFTCQTVYLQHIQTYQCFTTLLCSCSASSTPSRAIVLRGGGAARFCRVICAGIHIDGQWSHGSDCESPLGRSHWAKG